MERDLKLKRIHHVAYRCRDAKETVEFYQRILGMEFVLAIARDEVPSTGEPDPYMHVFLDAGMGNYLAFFELPNAKDMQADPHTPSWVQHIAFEVDSLSDLKEIKRRVQAEGIEVVGPTDHKLFQSIYFFDPTGHRVEATVNMADTDTMERLKELAPAMLQEWSETRVPPQHADWLYQSVSAEEQ